MMLITGIVSTQSKYEAGMGKAFEQMKAVKTAEDMGATAAFFERIADTEKDKWLPYYYAAYCNYLTGWMNPNADKDAVGEKAKALGFNAEFYADLVASIQSLKFELDSVKAELATLKGN